MKKDKFKIKKGLYSLKAKIDYDNSIISITHTPVDKSKDKSVLNFVFDQHDSAAELMESMLELRQKCLDHIAVKRSLECKKGLGYTEKTLVRTKGFEL